MQDETPAVNVEVTHWQLCKYDVDPVTGGKTLIETIQGGDNLPTETTFKKENQ